MSLKQISLSLALVAFAFQGQAQTAEPSPGPKKKCSVPFPVAAANIQSGNSIVVIGKAVKPVKSMSTLIFIKEKE